MFIRFARNYHAGNGRMYRAGEVLDVDRAYGNQLIADGAAVLNTSGDGSAVTAQVDPLTGVIGLSGQVGAANIQGRTSLIVIGDSRQQQYNNGVGAAVGSSGSALVINLANHGLASGDLVGLQALSPIGANGLWPATRISSSQFSVPYVGAVTGTPQVHFGRDVSNRSYVAWGNALLGDQGFKTVYNCGIGSISAADMVTRLPAMLDLVKPDNTFAALVLAGVNDRIQSAGVTEASVFENLKIIWNSLLDRGVYVIACGEIPLGPAHASFSAAFGAWQCRLNKLIRDYWSTRGAFGEYLDAWGVFSDPAQQDGRARAGYHTSDDIHPGATGGWAVGALLANQLSPRRARVRPRIRSWADSTDNDATSKNIIANPLFQGSGGTSAPGAGIGAISGTIPANWRVVLVAGPAGQNVAVSQVARTDGAGNDCVLTATSCDNTSQFYLGTINFGTGHLANRMTVGRRYRMTCEVNVTSATNLMEVFGYAAFTIDGVNYDAGLMRMSNTGSWPQVIGPVYMSCEFTLPPSTPGTITAALLNVRATFSGAGGAVIRVGTANVEDIT